MKEINCKNLNGVIVTQQFDKKNIYCIAKEFSM